jgi:hypothetical protein
MLTLERLPATRPSFSGSALKAKPVNDKRGRLIQCIPVVSFALSLCAVGKENTGLLYGLSAQAFAIVVCAVRIMHV